MRPRLHVVYITGFADAVGQPQYGEVLYKPIHADDLVRVIAAELRTG